jgi:hypothetical protein
MPIMGVELTRIWLFPKRLRDHALGQGNEECRHDEQGDKQSGFVVHQPVLQHPSGQGRVRGMGERMASDAQCCPHVLAAKATTHQAHGQQPMHPQRSPLPSCRHDDRPATVGRQVSYEHGCTRLQAALSGLCQCIRAGSCWIPGSWSGRGHPTALLSPVPP